MMDSATLRNRLREIVTGSVRMKPDATPSGGVSPVASGFSTAVASDSTAVASGFSRTEASRTDQHLELTLGGEWRDGCFVVERRVDPAACYGRGLVGDFAARVNAAADAAPFIASGAPARLPLLFFDLETTGLSGGAGTHAFLVGCGWFDDGGGFVTRQYLLAQFAGERALLTSVAEEFGRAGALVSFNGKSFDAPVLETRYLFHRLAWGGAHLPHVDVLHPARRFWKEDECSLMALERQVLGATRTGDVSGFEIPDRYFRFVRTGGAQPLAAVFEHNRLDLLSLAGLTARLLDLIRGGPDHVDNAREALALGYVYARGRDEVRAVGAYERAATLSAAARGHSAGLIRIDALRGLALAYRRARRYDDAAACWSALLGASCQANVEREALQALAIHHEHRARDLASAKAFALRNLTRMQSQPRPAWRQAAQQRLARIERKMSAYGSTGGLLE
jgi:uncharacterized protein YprB with RNaseH-like and TPR domain